MAALLLGLSRMTTAPSPSPLRRIGPDLYRIAWPDILSGLAAQTKEPFQINAGCLGAVVRMFSMECVAKAYGLRSKGDGGIFHQDGEGVHLLLQPSQQNPQMATSETQEPALQRLRVQVAG
jgi:hypothetical protein